MDTTRCPFCAEQILPAAKKCKHCGEWLVPPDNLRQSNVREKGSGIASKGSKRGSPGSRGSPTSFIPSLLLLVLLGGAGYWLATHHIVQTTQGLRVYPKSSPSFEGTYVDLSRLSLSDPGTKARVAAAMIKAGDAELLPGADVAKGVAEHLKDAAELGGRALSTLRDALQQGLESASDARARGYDPPYRAVTTDESDCGNAVALVPSYQRDSLVVSWLGSVRADEIVLVGPPPGGNYAEWLASKRVSGNQRYVVLNPIHYGHLQPRTEYVVSLKSGGSVVCSQWFYLEHR